MAHVRRVLWMAIGTAAVVGAFFVLFPTLDLAVSRLVYRSPPGEFVLSHYGVTLLLSRLLSTSCWLAVVGALVLLVANRLVGRSILRGIDTPRLLLILLTFVVGPGLIVNTTLKQYWGRARPIEIRQFGGDAQFSRAGVPATQCRRNCSFPSGDAAAAFAFAAVGVATGSSLVVGAALVVGVAVSAVRVLSGAHFVSDVAFSALVSLLTIVVLDRLLLRRQRAAPARPGSPGRITQPSSA